MIVENLIDSRLSYAVVLVAVLFFIKRRFFSSNNAKNWKAPFKNDTRLPTTALETDQEKRNDILKKGTIVPVTAIVLYAICYILGETWP